MKIKRSKEKIKGLGKWQAVPDFRTPCHRKRVLYNQKCLKRLAWQELFNNNIAITSYHLSTAYKV